MIIYILCILAGLLIGGLIMHLLDLKYLNSLITSFDNAQTTYTRGLENLRTENARLHSMINSYQIDAVKRRQDG